MGLEFESANRFIKITSPTVVISALLIYSAAMDWSSLSQNMGYTVPMKAVGKFPLGGEINSDSIFILINGWKIKWYDGTYTGIVTGTLITDDETPRTVPPDSGNVETVFTVSSAGTIAQSNVLDRLGGMIEDVSGNRYTQKSLEQAPSAGGGGLTEEERNHLLNVVALEATVKAVKTKTDTVDWTDVSFLKQIAQAIKAKTDSINWADVEFIKDIEGGRWKIANNQMIFYKDDNGTEVARFDLLDSSGKPSVTNVVERKRL